MPAIFKRSLPQGALGCRLSLMSLQSLHFQVEHLDLNIEELQLLLFAVLFITISATLSWERTLHSLREFRRASSSFICSTSASLNFSSLLGLRTSLFFDFLWLSPVFSTAGLHIFTILAASIEIGLSLTRLSTSPPTISNRDAIFKRLSLR